MLRVMGLWLMLRLLRLTLRQLLLMRLFLPMLRRGSLRAHLVRRRMRGLVGVPHICLAARIRRRRLVGWYPVVCRPLIMGHAMHLAMGRRFRTRRLGVSHPGLTYA